MGWVTCLLEVRSYCIKTQLTPARRLFATQARLSARASLDIHPSPPALPLHEQRLFEKLQKSSRGAFSTPTQIDEAADLNETKSPRTTTSKIHRPSSSVSETPSAEIRMMKGQHDEKHDDHLATDNIKATVDASGKGKELHPDVRRGARPEFEGDTNPKTGEVGGPKNEPLRWGAEVDWSYNGRVTDF